MNIKALFLTLIAIGMPIFFDYPYPHPGNAAADGIIFY
jgi:hypothetical protein